MPSSSSNSFSIAFRAVPSCGVGGVQGALPVPGNHLSYHRPATPAANNDMIGEKSVTIDGAVQHDKTIPLVDDRQNTRLK